MTNYFENLINVTTNKTISIAVIYLSLVNNKWQLHITISCLFAKFTYRFDRFQDVFLSKCYQLMMRLMNSSHRFIYQRQKTAAAVTIWYGFGLVALSRLHSSSFPNDNNVVSVCVWEWADSYGINLTLKQNKAKLWLKPDFNRVISQTCHVVLSILLYRLVGHDHPLFLNVSAPVQAVHCVIMQWPPLRRTYFPQ